MCVNCIRSQVDITEGIQKQVTILWCKNCGRYLQPPKHWLVAEPESKELLTYCIKRIKGMQRVKLVDAGFIWTEPHSMRLQVKLTVQGEVLNGAILQQSFVVEFIVERHMCPSCNRQQANPDSWIACVQVRQHVPHKRTFFFLEQLILKHGVDESCVNVKDIHEGIDFFFGSRAHAVKFIDFLQSMVPIRYRHDKQLVSHDVHTSSYNYKYTFSVEMSPICKDDLVCLPPRVAASHGGISPLVLCTRVTNALTMTDPVTLRSAVLEAPAFWRSPFRALMSSRQLVEYIVLDVEGVDPRGPGGYNHNGRWSLAECTLARLSDFGANDKTYTARTHLGHLLHPGDHAMGYDVANANLVDSDFEAAVHRGWSPPDVVLVRKSYEERRRKRRARGARRAWKLKRMSVEYAADDEGGAAAAAGGGHQHPQRGGRHVPSAADLEEADLERFMEELEEDPDMRNRVALYRDPAGGGDGVRAGGAGGEVETDEESEVPEVPLEELLDDLAAMQLEEEENGEEGRRRRGVGGDVMME
jgi:nonsense-mediated mRNA decay protein 3